MEDQILEKLNQISDLYLNPESLKFKNGNLATSSLNLPEPSPLDTAIIADPQPSLTKAYNKNHRHNIVSPSNDLFATPLNPINSKIISDSESIKSMFDRAVDKVDLLFRASEKKFDIREFHKACDENEHTLVLIETEFGKVIGGYTPIAWRSTKKHWAPDKLQESFVFSLNMR
jgi:hypothetical protein